MKNDFDLTQYINNSYADSKAISFEKASIKIKKSAQVRIKNEKPKEYYEIGSQAISSKGDLTTDDLKKCEKANIGSLNNQRLEIGDLLITMRSQFRYAKVVTKELLSRKFPVVAVKGQIILRTKDINKAEFLKFYLERDEIQNYINNHENAKTPNGKYSIEPGVIQSILLPDCINGNLTLFLENSIKIMQVVSKGEEFAKELEFLSNMNREKICKKGLKKSASYSEMGLWNKVGEALSDLIKIAKGGEKI